MPVRNIRVGTFSLMLAATMVACGGGDSPDAGKPAESGAPAAAPAGQKVDPATAGEVKGTVVVDGVLPKNELMKMNADPACVKAASGPQYQETYEVGPDGKTLGNVLVYVKDGLGNYVFDSPTEPARIVQRDCRYRPHVLGVRVGQPLEMINDDPTLHNIHGAPKVNQEFNNGQPIQGMKTIHTFTSKEVVVPLKCDVHSWMNAYVGVIDHPYFTVTDKSGAFELKSLPPGTYTIEAWHEKLGTQTQSVTVGQKETKDVAFTFKSSAPTTTD